MRRPAELVQIGPFHYEGPRCPCGNYLCRPEDDPYCPRSALFVGRRVSVAPPADGRSLSEQYLADWDAMVVLKRQEVREEFKEFDKQRKPKRKRRSVKEMAEWRAKNAATMEAVSKAVTPDWLAEPDPMLEEILRNLRAAED